MLLSAATMRSGACTLKRHPTSSPSLGSVWSTSFRAPLSVPLRFGGNGATLDPVFQYQRVTSSPLVRPLRAATPGGSGVSAETTEDEVRILGQTLLTWKKVFPLCIMFFCILFNYTCLRNTKDVLVVTAAGAEAIPFLKALNLPMGIAFTVVYAQLSSHLSSANLFYACLLPFLAFFAMYAFVVYPNREALHPHGLADHLLAAWGPAWHAPLALLRTWTHCAFYMVAELWGSVVISLLFWGYSNSVMSVDEAKAFYPFFGLVANVSLILAGHVTHWLSHSALTLAPGGGGDHWTLTLQALMALVVLSGGIVAGLHAAMQRWVVPEVHARRSAAAAPAPAPKKARVSMSTMDSMRFLAASPYIRDLGTMVIAFGVAISLVEVTWKAKLKTAFPSPSDYSDFMGMFSECVGAMTLGSMLVGRWVLGHWGWQVAALTTPSVLAITAAMFFALVLTGDLFAAPLAAVGTTPLMAAVFVGAAQNAFSRSAKYSLFDPCKEMAYIPLDAELRNKGKAAVDVMGNLVGKSGGAFVQQAAIMASGSLAASTPILGSVLALVIAAWMRAVLSLSTQFHALMHPPALLATPPPAVPQLSEASPPPPAAVEPASLSGSQGGATAAAAAVTAATVASVAPVVAANAAAASVAELAASDAPPAAGTTAGVSGSAPAGAAKPPVATAAAA